MDLEKLNKTILHIEEKIKDSKTKGKIRSLIKKLDKKITFDNEDNENEFTRIKNKLIQIILENKTYESDKNILAFIKKNSTISASPLGDNAAGPASPLGDNAAGPAYPLGDNAAVHPFVLADNNSENHTLNNSSSKKKITAKQKKQEILKLDKSKKGKSKGKSKGKFKGKSNHKKTESIGYGSIEDETTIQKYERELKELENEQSEKLKEIENQQRRHKKKLSKKNTSKSQKVTKKRVISPKTRNIQNTISFLDSKSKKPVKKLINNDKLKLKNINDNLKKFLGDFSFEIIDEKKKTFSADLAELNREGIINELIKEANMYLEKSKKSIKKRIVIIDGENLLRYKIFNAQQTKELIINLIKKDYFVFILRHNQNPLPNFKKLTKEENELLNKYMVEIHKGEKGSMIDDFFVLLLSVLAHKSKYYSVPTFLINLKEKDFKRSFVNAKSFKQGTRSLQNKIIGNKFFNNLSNVNIKHPNNLILTLDNFKWCKLSEQNTMKITSIENNDSSLYSNNSAGPAEPVAPNTESGSNTEENNRKIVLDRRTGKPLSKSNIQSGYTTHKGKGKAK